MVHKAKCTREKNKINVSNKVKSKKAIFMSKFINIDVICLMAFFLNVYIVTLISKEWDQSGHFQVVNHGNYSGREAILHNRHAARAMQKYFNYVEKREKKIDR